MSFTWFADQPLRTREQVAREVHAVSLARGLDELATVLCLMGISTEVGTGTGEERQWWCPANDRVPATKNYPNDSRSDDNRSSGYLQQQPGPNGEPWWGTPEDMMTLPRAANTFLERLADDYSRAANNPALAGQFVQRVQGSAFPDRYAGKWDEAWAVLRRALADQPSTPTTPEEPMAWTGDPVWLEEVLREALGDRLVVEADWAERGTGVGENGGNQMGPIWGVMIHHTGNDRETVERIRDGRDDLPGPLSQCLITPDGKCHLIAIGPCNHAGIGSYPGIPANMGNTRLIGFECAYPTIRPDGSYDPAQRWPDSQIITMRDAATAVVKKLGTDQGHVIGHKEYANRPPNVKIDPGNMDMNWFRGEVAKDLAGQFDPKPSDPPPVVVPPVSSTAIPTDFDQHTYLQINGRWEMLGWQTVVETLAELRDAATGSHDAGKTGFKLGAKPEAV